MDGLWIGVRARERNTGAPSACHGNILRTGQAGFHWEPHKGRRLTITNHGDVVLCGFRISIPGSTWIRHDGVDVHAYKERLPALTHDIMYRIPVYHFKIRENMQPWKLVPEPESVQKLGPCTKLVYGSHTERGPMPRGRQKAGSQDHLSLAHSHQCGMLNPPVLINSG